MQVLDRAVMGKAAVEAARRNHGDLHREVHELLDDRFLVADEAPHPLALFDVVDAVLALAVVTERRGLDDGGKADDAEGHGELVERLRLGKRRHRVAAIGEKPFFAGALLRDVQRGSAGPHRHDLGRGIGRVVEDVLEFERDHVDAAGEGANRIEVVVLGADFQIGDLTGGRVDARRERVNAVAHAPGLERQHAAELPAAKHANGGAGQHDPVHGRVSWRTFAVCSARNWRSRSRSSGRDVARMPTASSPALVAPGFPIASVPTGTPPGIWTIDSSESRPWSDALCTGTPSTGRIVCDGHHARQVRRAAGAGDDHLNAARLRALRELRHPDRRAVGRHHFLFEDDAETLEHLGRVRHRVPVGGGAHDQRDERCVRHGRKRKVYRRDQRIRDQRTTGPGVSAPES